MLKRAGDVKKYLYLKPAKKQIINFVCINTKTITLLTMFDFIDPHDGLFTFYFTLILLMGKDLIVLAPSQSRF